MSFLLPMDHFLDKGKMKKVFNPDAGDLLTELQLPAIGAH